MNLGDSIQPIIINRFWQHRLCELLGFIGVSTVGLIIWNSIIHTRGVMSLFDSAQTTVALVMSTLLVIACVLFYVLPLKKHLLLSIRLLFVFAAISTASFVVSYNMHGFVVIWGIILLLSGISGALTTFIVGVIGAGMVIYSDLSVTTMLSLIVVVVIPACISILLFRLHNGRSQDNEETAIESLTDQLTTISAKSDIVINSIDDGVLALDEHANIELVNPAAQKMVGWGGDDALGLSYKSILKLVDQKDQSLVPANDPIYTVLSTKKSLNNNNLKLVTNSGKHVYVSINVSPSKDGGVIVVFRDITKAKKEEQAQTEFISTASHEMRTPVAAIEGYLGLALNPNTAQIDEKARTFINKAHESTQHLGRLFQDLLDITKADDGRLTNNPKVIDITKFVYDITQSFAPKAQAKQLELVFMPEQSQQSATVHTGERRLSQALYTEVDKDHLREVVDNLIENAIKYTKQGKVTVDLNGDNEKVRISVKDSGIGIPNEDQPHLFQKFYRVDNTDTREIGGTGLGLYLSRKLVESMNGRIWCDSEYQKGSTFTVELSRLDSLQAEQKLNQQNISTETSNNN